MFIRGRLWPLCAESDTFSISELIVFFRILSGRPGSDEKMGSPETNMFFRICQKCAKILGSFRFFDFFRVFSCFFGKK